MKTLSIISFAVICFVIGLTFHAYQKEWVVLLLPHQTADIENKPQTADTAFSQKKITLFFWKHEQWRKEHISIIWSPDLATNIKTITNNWLMLLEDEKIIDTDIQLLSAVITPSKELFLSFNKNIFSGQESTYQKLMIIHGILKTIHENKIPVQTVRFLIHHQTMIDDHLNFLISWPITGYINNH
ncbi:hypothetical protein KBC04_04255 [Candidatus Babeliales bacterium]|nr:hypothetical protein [Candidatus Babeliales bacterium]MBP9844278.1 hypothetical protein [Candidatus Babeliales bacterium]